MCAPAWARRQLRGSFPIILYPSLSLNLEMVIFGYTGWPACPRNPTERGILDVCHSLTSCGAGDQNAGPRALKQVPRLQSGIPSHQCFPFKKLCVCVVCVRAHACGHARVHVMIRGYLGMFLLPCGLQELSSGHQTWRQAPLLTETASWPFSFL